MKDNRLVILDGGMGTTLQDVFNADISSTLWSSVLLSTEEGQQTLSKLHEAFLHAGAELILTCTYQASFDGFARAGFSRPDAIKLMRGAVALAHASVSSHTSSTQLGRSASNSSPPQVVLSLSCFGATVGPPGEEYTGRYPPPYGPSPSPTTSISTTSSSAGPPFASEDEKARATAALAEWHYERVKVFADDEATWRACGGIAFETLPLLYEGIAIRRAMHRLRTELSSMHSGSTSHWPPWWISFVCPDGRLPEHAVELEDIVPALFDAHSGLDAPDGIGINCTKLRFLPDIVESFERSLRNTQPDRPHSHPHPRPWLVLYPDGGLTYDPKSRTWSSASNAGEAGSDSAGGPEQAWADQLAGLASRALGAKMADGREVWSKVVVGGCCKADPTYIAALAHRIQGIP